MRFDNVTTKQDSFTIKFKAQNAHFYEKAKFIDDFFELRDVYISEL